MSAEQESLIIPPIYRWIYRLIADRSPCEFLLSAGGIRCYTSTTFVNLEGSYVFFAACCYFPDIRQPWPSGLSSGFRMAYHADCFWRTVLVCRVCINVNIVHDYFVRAYKSPDDPPVPHTVDCDCVHFPYSCRSDWVFTFSLVWYAVFLCHSVWSWRRCD